MVIASVNGLQARNLANMVIGHFRDIFKIDYLGTLTLGLTDVRLQRSPIILLYIIAVSVGILAAVLSPECSL